MAGYGYGYRGGYTTDDDLAPRTCGWSKPSYATDHTCQPVIIDAEGRRKQIISYTPNGGSEFYVMKTEIVEHVPFVTGYKQSNPVRYEAISGYSDDECKWNRPSSPEKWRKSSSPVRYHVEEKLIRPSSPVRYHTEEKWNRPSSPVRYHAEEKWNKPSSPVRYPAEEKWNKPSSPVRYRAEEKWNKPSSPVRYHAEEKWNRPSSPAYERPQQVEDFLTKIQTEASRPRKFGPLSGSFWRQPPNSYQVNTGYGDQGDLSKKPSGNHDVPYKRDNYPESTGVPGSGWAKPSHGAWSKGQGANLSEPTSDINTAMEYLKEAVKLSSDGTPPSKYAIPISTAPKREGDLSNKESLKPSGNTIRNENYDRPYKTENSMEPTKTAGAGNGLKPSFGAWSTGQGANLSKPTSDINTKEAVKPPPTRYTIPASTGPKRDTYSGTIDSREAERKYGGLNSASRPKDNYTRTIDSREAARKYGGTAV